MVERLCDIGRFGLANVHGFEGVLLESSDELHDGLTGEQLTQDAVFGDG